MIWELNPLSYDKGNLFITNHDTKTILNTVLWMKLKNVALMAQQLMRDVQKHTNFQQIIVGSLGKAPPSRGKCPYND